MKLIQPDRKSCGAAALVMARRLSDPDYGERINQQSAFSREVRSLHQRLTSLVDTAGGFQMPWLRTIGTAPWAAARELRLITDTDYSIHSVRLAGQSWEYLQHASAKRPMAAYIGDRLCPRHVVLVAEVVDDAAWTYEPHSGLVTLISRRRWTEGPLRVAGWDQPWLVVAPDDAISRA